jgi:exodeoxyribonuclease VII large subunit
MRAAHGGADPDLGEAAAGSSAGGDTSGMSANPQPTQYGDRRVYSVAGFNQGVGGWLQRLPEVWVEGEIAELKQQGRWAFAYLTLKDPATGACLPALISRTRLDAVQPALRAGDRVHALGRAEMYAKKGELRFRLSAIEQFGLGLVLRQIEELKQRLAAEGLFAAERKRDLPFLPRVVGLICGTDAAAKRDVLETAARRYPPARFRVVESAVQGPGAVPQILAALHRLERDEEVDVIVLARGGGSFEDLLPFSDERLVRAVAACATPVVSAVGHEQDTPIVDHAADVRAGTPSLAAKLVVPDHAAVGLELDALAGRAGRALQGRAQRCRESLEMLVSRPAFADPRSWITVRRATLEKTRDGLDRWPRERLERERVTLRHAHDRLRLLGPAATLERGYAIVQDADGRVVMRSGATARGDRIAVRLAEGRIAATVEEVAE